MALHTTIVSAPRTSLQKLFQPISHVRLFFNLMDYSPAGFPVSGIFQARRLEWVAISSCRGSSRPRDRPASPALAGPSPLEQQGGLSLGGSAEESRKPGSHGLPFALCVFPFPEEPLLQARGTPQYHLLSIMNTYALFRGSVNKVSQESGSVMLPKQVILNTEPALFLRFLIICGNNTAVKKKNTGLSPKSFQAFSEASAL